MAVAYLIGDEGRFEASHKLYKGRSNTASGCSPGGRGFEWPFFMLWLLVGASIFYYRRALVKLARLLRALTADFRRLRRFFACNVWWFMSLRSFACMIAADLRTAGGLDFRRLAAR